MASQEQGALTAVQPQRQQTQRTATTQQMTMSPDIYGYAAGTEESDEDEEGGCNCAKTVFYIGLAASALMVFWFCALRVPMMTTRCPFQFTLPVGGNGTTTTKTLPVKIADMVQGNSQPELQYGCDGKLKSAGVTEFLELINRRGIYANSYLSIYFTTSGFLIDTAQTVAVVIACIALAPAVECKVFKLLAMTCFIGIGLAFLMEAVQAITIIIIYFTIIGGANDLIRPTVSMSYSADPLFLMFRFLQMIVELILALLLILVAFLTCKAYCNELTTSSQQNNNGGNSGAAGYQQYQPYMGPAVAQQNDKSKMRTYTQLEGMM